jgi:tRNA-Thr(GGU) m(6)t(6)A37 methyltransferase TsaA
MWEGVRQLIATPIGHVRSPFLDKADAPRQAAVARGVAGTVELLPQYADALSDLEGFDRIWLLFWFDRAEGWRSKVLPPRSDRKRGLFATRSPHRPNPIGLSAVRLERVEGLVLHIRDLDLIDRTPILDVKPYIAYADAFPDASTGWLEPDAAGPAAVATPADPRARWTVRFEPAAEEALAWIAARAGEGLRGRIEQALALGPAPHAYRRIKEAADGRRTLAAKEWRAEFRVESAERRAIVVERIRSGYRPRDLEEGQTAAHVLHRAFAEAIGAGGSGFRTGRGRE